MLLNAVEVDVSEGLTGWCILAWVNLRLEWRAFLSASVAVWPAINERPANVPNGGAWYYTAVKYHGKRRFSSKFDGSPMVLRLDSFRVL